MSFAANENRQLSMGDSFLHTSKRTQKLIKNSWAQGFADVVFPAIDEERFRVLYSENLASRPNTPVNIVIGALILKEMFGLTDDELFASILCDIRFQHALHTSSFEEQPFSDRTVSRFRERLYLYEIESGKDLLQEEMESMAEKFRTLLKLDGSLRRMDSVMVSSSCKKMSRLEVLYTCVANMVKAIRRTGEYEWIKGYDKYAEETHKNEMIYYRKKEEIGSRLQEVITDAKELLKRLPAGFGELEEYSLLQRVVKDQTKQSETGTVTAKDKKDIEANSLQNPSDPDATYRNKAGEGHTGYVGNFVETFQKDVALITSYDYEINSHSDSSFCQETIEKLGMQESPVRIIADGAYSGSDRTAQAKSNNIELITTALIGKIPDEVCAHFEIDQIEKQVICCPAGKHPYRTRHYEKIDMYRASMPKKTCQDCPLQNQCGVKFQKNSACVSITPKTIERAKQLTRMSTKDYIQLARQRNAIEGIPSVLRRKYRVDEIPVRGYVRSKQWFSFKIAAINAKRVLKATSFTLHLCTFLKCAFHKQNRLTYFPGCATQSGL